MLGRVWKSVKIVPRPRQGIYRRYRKRRSFPPERGSLFFLKPNPWGEIDVLGEVSTFFPTLPRGKPPPEEVVQNNNGPHGETEMDKVNEQAFNNQREEERKSNEG
ncbi:unnamed protein product, partial [Ectocarpus sp. 12 AP-2014]